MPKTKHKKTIRAGNLVKTILYTAPTPNDSSKARSARSKATTAAQTKLNDRTAQSRLETLLAANFIETDFFCALTFDPEHEPKTRADCKKAMRSFIKKLRTTRDKTGQLLKYVYAVCRGSNNGRYHIHAFINDTGKENFKSDFEELKSLWNQGNADVERIADNKHVDRAPTWAADLANYVTSENIAEKEDPKTRLDNWKLDTRLWTSSRNLIHPEPITEYVEENESITFPPGVEVLDKSEEIINQFGHYIYIKYLLKPGCADYIDPQQIARNYSGYGRKQKQQNRKQHKKKM